MALPVAVSGATGRMGRTLAGLIAAADDLRLVGGLDRDGVAAEEAEALGYERIEAPEAAGEILRAADVLLDFSAPPFLARLLETQADALAGRALVVGTTGLDDDVRQRLEAAAERGPVIVASNFSVGVNLLLALVEEAAATLTADRYDAEIVEAHHRGKADAPSGTALALGQAIASARDRALDELRLDGRSGHTGERPTGQIGFHAVRGGGIAGEHSVRFLGEREQITLAHTAGDRTLFAEGALVAARWVARKAPGWYTMEQVLGL